MRWFVLTRQKKSIFLYRSRLFSLVRPAWTTKQAYLSAFPNMETIELLERSDEVYGID